MQDIDTKYELLKSKIGEDNQKLNGYYFILKNNKELVNDLYTKYKNSSFNRIKLYKLKSGKFQLNMEKLTLEYQNILTAKICFIILYEVNILINDTNYEYFKKSAIMITSSLELEELSND